MHSLADCSCVKNQVLDKCLYFRAINYVRKNSSVCLGSTSADTNDRIFKSVHSDGRQFGEFLITIKIENNLLRIECVHLTIIFRKI